MLPRYRSGRRLSARVLSVLPVFIGVIAIGTIGYWLLEDWSWIESLYQAVITISTVGFGEVRPLSAGTRVFTIVLIFLGVGGFTYTFGVFADYLITGELQGIIRSRRMRIRIDNLKDHSIVCGFGRMGRRVADEFQREGESLVVVDPDQAVSEAVVDAGFLAIHGNAGDDSVLRRAGIEHASRLIAATGSDATNLMIALSGRALNPDLLIIARVDDPANEPKLLTAGANRVVAVYRSGGLRMAQIALHPHIVDFSDLVMYDEATECGLEELLIQAGSRVDGKPIHESYPLEEGMGSVLFIRRSTGEVIIVPPPDTILRADDVAVAFGTSGQLGKMRDLAGAT